MAAPTAVPEIMEHIGHRPWPLPNGPWVMGMQWHELLFMHWAVEPELLRSRMPASIPLDTFDGKAWLGITPFSMRGVRLRGLPAVGPVSAFPELNVRTYTTIDGKPGVWFFSLDAGSRLAVRGARWTFGLPYYDAHMRCERADDGWVHFRSQRTHHAAPPARLALRYRPTGPAPTAAPGSLEHFLYERYCLYTVDRTGRPWRGDIHHLPWPIRPAEVRVDELDMTQKLGFPLTGEPARVHYVERLDVVAWPPGRV